MAPSTTSSSTTGGGGGSRSRNNPKSFRKKRPLQEEEDDEEQEQLKFALDEVKLLQKLREKRYGIPVVLNSPNSNADAFNKKSANKGDAGGLRDAGGGDAEKDDLVLQDTFAQETAVTIEDPNMVRYIEHELAKQKGKNVDSENQVENELKRVEDELYAIPEHLKVKQRNSNESSTQWTTGIAEVHLPIEYKLRNIEETEAAKKLLQEKRLASKAKPESTLPSSYSADYFQRGQDYAEKLRGEHPELHKKRSLKQDGDMKSTEGGDGGSSVEGPRRRQAATDQFMLERFRKRERNRGMRR